MIVPLLAAAACLAGTGGTPAAGDTRVYELRTYYAAPGKLDDLHARFRNHTVQLFRRHGMTSIGYWVPAENPDRKLIYLLAFPDRAARDKAFAEFGADPEWQKAAKESEKDGRLVERIDSVFLNATDFTPSIHPTRSNPPRVFELRLYHPAAGKMDALQARFRDHTIALFRRRGIASIGYWVPTEADPHGEETLIYLLAHRNQESAKKAWDAFRADPEWVKVKAESEKDGPLLASTPISVFLTPTDYSPTR